MNLLDGAKIGIGEGAFYAVFGFAVVFLGITLLVLFFMSLGAIMKRVNGRKERKAARTDPQAELAQPAAEAEEGVSPEVVAAITAALYAYYEGEQVKCDFVVRRIKRI